MSDLVHISIRELDTGYFAGAIIDTETGFVIGGGTVSFQTIEDALTSLRDYATENGYTVISEGIEGE